MASRPELIQICNELDIDCTGKYINQMKEEIRKEADKRFNKRKNISVDNMSDALIKFLTKEYDYVIKNKKGDIIE